MNLEAIAIIVWLGGLTVAIGWYRRSRPHDAALPPELRGARLVYAEHLFRSPGPVLLRAKVDRVYRNVVGALVLVELKTRSAHRAYWSDVIELSAQRFALSGQTGEAVADHAYVLTERPDGHRTGCHRVRLMEPVDLIALVERREQVLERPNPGPPAYRGCVGNVRSFGHVIHLGGDFPPIRLIDWTRWTGVGFPTCPFYVGFQQR